MSLSTVQIKLTAALTFCVLATVANAAAWIEPNKGQTDQRYDYIIRASDITVLVAPTYLDMQLPKGTTTSNKPGAPGPSKKAPAIKSPNQKSLNIRLNLLGANKQAKAKGHAKKTGVSNYFRGSKPESWLTNVPHLEQVRFENLYPGIDLVYRLNGEHLEYDFEVAAGADLSLIRMQLEGATGFTIAKDGTWVTNTGAGELRQMAPVVYQMSDEERSLVDGTYLQHDDGTVGFVVANHDQSKPVIIDPVIEFSGYIGGTGYETGLKLKETAAGNYVLTGVTSSVDLPGLVPGQLTSFLDVYVMEIDATTGAPNWVTVLGGAETDLVESMEIDSQGNIVVVGYTESDDYPVVNALQPTFAGNDDPFNVPNDRTDATVTKVSADGSTLVFSTYLGGVDYADFAFGFERAHEVTIDAADAIYVVGETAAPDFPTTHTLNSRACLDNDLVVPSNLVSDVFVTKISASGALERSVCIGGGDRDVGSDIKLGSATEVYVGGYGKSGDFPGTSGSVQSPLAENTAFVFKLNDTLSTLEFGTYIGVGLIRQIVVDNAGAVFGAGLTRSDLFPVTPGAFQTSFSGTAGSTYNSFVFKLQSDGQVLDFASYLGGSANDFASALEVDSTGRAYVMGTTVSADFPLRDPINDSNGAVLGGVKLFGNVNGGLTDVEMISTNDFVYRYVTFTATDGVNMRYGLAFDSELGWPFAIGTAENDTRALALTLNLSNFENEDVVYANADAANELYRRVPQSQNYALAKTFGTQNQDSRDVVALRRVGDGTPRHVLFAHYGEQNEIYHVDSNAPPVLIGRVDGLTTSIAIGEIGPGTGDQSIVFVNEGQDVRLYPDLGNDQYGTPIIISNAATNVTSLAIGDVNGDGENDLVIGNLDAPVQILLFASGLPLAPTDLSVGSHQTLSVLLADPDQDGDLDLLVGNTGEDQFYLNEGAGQLTLEERYTGSQQPTVTMAALNNFALSETLLIGSPTKIQHVYSAGQSLFLSVFNSSGSDVEFSTYIDGGGEEELAGGMNFGRGPGTKLLIASTTFGSLWPQVGSSLAQSEQKDAAFMVLNLDQDNDTVLDNLDNCLLHANPNQTDSNADGFGNACDADLNNDGIINFGDVALFAQAFMSANADADFNGDGVVNFGDYVLLVDSFLQPPGPSGLMP